WGVGRPRSYHFLTPQPQFGIPVVGLKVGHGHLGERPPEAPSHAPAHFERSGMSETDHISLNDRACALRFLPLAGWSPSASQRQSCAGTPVSAASPTSPPASSAPVTTATARSAVATAPSGQPGH